MKRNKKSVFIAALFFASCCFLGGCNSGSTASTSSGSSGSTAAISGSAA